MNKYFDGYWIWFFGDKEPDYSITGKYLFFSTHKNKLVRIALNEIEHHGFYEAKVNETLLDGQNEHVLCIYYKDDSRKYELADRNSNEYKEKYRYWKSDDATLRGEYSQEFLTKLKNKTDYKYMIKNKR